MELSLEQKRTPYLFLTGLSLLAAGLPLSLFLTSLAQFFLAGSFLFEGNIMQKFRRFYADKAALFIALLWLIHLLGMLWTTDVKAGMNDLRIKLPILLLPLIIAGTPPLQLRHIRLVLLVFTASVFIGSLISMSVLLGFIERNIYDIRNIFIFSISHIRFALFTCLSIFICIWFGFRQPAGRIAKVVSVILTAWFVLFLVIIESVTGIVILGLVSFYWVSRLLVSVTERKYRILTGILVFAVTGLILGKVATLINEALEKKPFHADPSEKTARGNAYYFNIDEPLYENGFPVWVYVSEEELREEWNRRSRIPFDSLDERGQVLKFTLVRFLASKGVRKDGEAVLKMSDAEIRSVERGVANVNFQDLSSLKNRIKKIVWEMDPRSSGSNPGGHSVAQRFEFWKAACGLIGDHILFGVGTGDLHNSYAAQYEKMNSPLEKQYRLRAHNQYLTIWVALGVFAFLYFLFIVFYPLMKPGLRSGLFISFMMIVLISMLTEDTLETQAGVTFFAFFFMLLRQPALVQDSR